MRRCSQESFKEMVMSESRNQSSRRGFMLGAAAAGAATAAVTTLPKPPVAETPVAQEVPVPPANGGGYRVSEHVKRYYRTTLV
jgi:cobalamin biosynthesis protein CbiD